ncbi:hypothetical protein, variant [Verruconis gallopava]|uniref:Zn(2)-C6 fungal-type domain-containing protein n=1 Tax=Verruconis gallopava TaxID=253628 RepID=A0A0D1YPI9_9PEZI|nr:hypothetical protein, variant [Verruconis gallopava]KIW02537.1 hypothetical protein, variant [Verruconis gallopava]
MNGLEIPHALYMTLADLSGGDSDEQKNEPHRKHAENPPSLSRNEGKAPLTRVCERCIKKKVKCSQGRPACSRCQEAGLPCIYSATRRKPGPSKGSKRVQKATRALPQDSGSTPEILMADWATEQFSSSLDYLHEDFLQLPNSAFYPDDAVDSERTLLVTPTPTEEEKELINLFFTYVHPSVRIFDQQTFQFMYDLGTVDNNLLLAILSISTALLKRGDQTAIAAAENTLTMLASLNLLENSRNMASLHQFQLACLLAYYIFHQYPGQDSWLRIGKLSRIAYQFGLNQIDNPHQVPSVISACANSDEIEAWRRIWWFIFCLDSYSNIPAATPLILERESIRTALPRPMGVHIENEMEPAIYLDDPEFLWNTVKAITSSNTMVNENLHIVTTAILNEAAHLQRLVFQNPSDKLRNRLVSLDAHLSAIRLALPPRFLDPFRNVLGNESSSAYHARLICVLHLHAARILLFLPLNVFDAEERNDRWQRTLEYCEDVVSVVKQWDSLHSLSVDPAVCFIGFAAMSILHLHSKCMNGTNSEMLAKLKADQGVIMLFIEQFASFWELPKYLKSVFLQASENIPQQLNITEVESMMSHLNLPLHQKWTSKLLSNRVCAF